MKILAFMLIFLIPACSSIDDISCPPVEQLKTAESDLLNQMVLNNHFISGCVTELIADIKELQPIKIQNNCKDNFAKTLSYDQWVKIYNSCMVK